MEETGGVAGWVKVDYLHPIGIKLRVTLYEVGMN